MTLVDLLLALETISRGHPNRVLQLLGTVPSLEDPAQLDPFELVIYRGFSSSTTHPTAFDPDEVVLPQGVVLTAAQLLQGPLNPAHAIVLLGPEPVATFLSPERWDV
jgi:hypothetical protein